MIRFSQARERTSQCAEDATSAIRRWNGSTGGGGAFLNTNSRQLQASALAAAEVGKPQRERKMGKMEKWRKMGGNVRKRQKYRMGNVAKMCEIRRKLEKNQREMRQVGTQYPLPHQL